MVHEKDNTRDIRIVTCILDMIAGAYRYFSQITDVLSVCLIHNPLKCYQFNRDY